MSTTKASDVLPPPAPPINANKASSPAPASPPAQTSKKDNKESLDPNDPDPKVIDMQTLGQLLEMDEGPDHEFSRSLVEEYFEQASETMTEIESNLNNEASKKKERLDVLSSKAHFLKGSSATLGVANVRDTCETLQHLGKCKDETGANPLSEDEAWDQTMSLMPTLRDDLKLATRWLKVLCNIEEKMPTEEPPIPAAAKSEETKESDSKKDSEDKGKEAKEAK